MAAMGLVGLKYLDEDNKRRREISKIYDKELENVREIKIIKHNPECESSNHLYQIRVKNRDQIVSYLNTHQIHPGVHYKDNTEYDLYKESYGTCPHSHKISKELITLPIHCHLKDEDCLRVVEILKQSIKLF